MPPIKKGEIEGKVKKPRGSRRGMKKYKRSTIQASKLSLTPSKFVSQVMTRSKSRLLNQLKDECLKTDLITMSNETSSNKRRKRKSKTTNLTGKTSDPIITISSDEMDSNPDDQNLDSSVFPSTSSHHHSSPHSSKITDILKETKDTETNVFNSLHSEKLEISENCCSTDPPPVLPKVKVAENTGNGQTTSLTPKSPNHQFSLNNSDDQENDIDNVNKAETVEKDIVGILTKEMWKKKQLYHLQENIVEMENKKLDTFTRIFKKWYGNLFFRNKTDV